MIVFATGNEGKLKEIREILGENAPEMVSLRQAGLTAEAEETGTTFSENAEIKAREIHEKLRLEAQEKGMDTVLSCGARFSDIVVLADDSGLCIDALYGAPGVKSARFLGHDTSYGVKNRALTEALMEVPAGKRGAQFVCDICAVLPDGTAFHAEGVMTGEVAKKAAGCGGFGYDPIFWLPERGITSAELPPGEKNRISHRGQALHKMMEQLNRKR